MNEQKLRSVIRQALNETTVSHRRALHEYDDDYGGGSGGDSGGALYKAFVSPFVDVAKSANLFTKDVLNILGFAFKTLITFSPKKLREAREKYTTRRDKIAQEWKPLMNKAKASIDNADVGLMAMVFAPNVYFGVLGSKIAGAGIDTADEYLQAMGLKQYVSSKSASLENKLENWLESEERERNREQGTRDREGLGPRLRMFFFGEAAWHQGSVLTEAEADADKKDITDKKQSAGATFDYNQTAQKLFGEGGPLSDLFAKAQEEMLAAKKEQVDELVGTANIIVGGLLEISRAKSIEDFEGALGLLSDQLVQRGDKEVVDLDPINKAIQGLKSEMQKKYDEVVKGKASPAPKGADKGDIETVAKRASQEAFEAAACELRKMASDAASEAAKNYKQTISSELVSDLPTKGPMAAALESSKSGQALIALIKKAVDSIGGTGGTAK